jgi:hypothetical protein
LKGISNAQPSTCASASYSSSFLCVVSIIFLTRLGCTHHCDLARHLSRRGCHDSHGYVRIHHLHFLLSTRRSFVHALGLALTRTRAPTYIGAINGTDILATRRRCRHRRRGPVYACGCSVLAADARAGARSVKLEGEEEHPVRGYISAGKGRARACLSGVRDCTVHTWIGERKGTKSHGRRTTQT